MDKSDAHTGTLEGSSINLTDPFLERFRIRKRRDYSARDSSLEGEPSKRRAMESAFKQTEPVLHDPFAEYVNRADPTCSAATTYRKRASRKVSGIIIVTVSQIIIYVRTSDKLPT